METVQAGLPAGLRHPIDPPSPDDVGQARETLQLIIERGYNRGRGDLLEQLEQFVADRSR